jgi:hypothetical protein
VNDATLAIGDLVERLADTALSSGQSAAARRYGIVLEVEDENGRVAVQVQGRQHPLHILRGQIRRLNDGPHCVEEALGPVTVIERSRRHGFGANIR